MGYSGVKTRGDRLQGKLAQATRVLDRDNQHRGEQNVDGFTIRYSSTRSIKYRELLESQYPNTPAGVMRHRRSHGQA